MIKLMFVLGLIANAGMIAYGQESALSAQKQAPLKAIVPGAYGKVEVRHSVARKVRGDEVNNDVPKVDVRPTLGSAFFDERLDTSFTWIFRKSPDTSKISRVALFNESKFNVLKGKNGDIGPYAVTYQADGQSFSESYVGLDANLKTEFATDVGLVKLSAYSEPLAVFQSGRSSSARKVDVRNDTGQDAFSLNDEGETQIEQRDPTLWNYSGVEGRFMPSINPAFFVALGADVTQRWRPKYSTSADSENPSVELDGYESGLLMTNILKSGYKLSDTVSINGALRQNVGGFYAQRVSEEKPDPTGYWGGTRWETRLALSATLF